MERTRPVLIPQPKEVTYRRGQFALGRGLRVSLLGGGELEQQAPVGLLLAELSELAGGELKVQTTAKPAGQPYSLRLGRAADHAPVRRSARQLPQEGYELRVTPGGLSVVGRDLAGLCYGVATLRQLAAGGRRVPCVTVRDWPELSLRGIHFDLKGVMPTFPALMDALLQMSRLKLNCILLEYEDKFPWSEETGLASPLALSRRRLGRFLQETRARHIRVIPLVQTLGHAEMVLHHRRYAHLRELRDRYYQYCPSNPGSLKLVKRLIDEVAEFHGEEPLFHVGADEAWLLGSCPRCERAVRKVGKNGLYLKHMRPVWEHVFSLGKRPVTWDDMLRHFTLKELGRVPRDVILMYWLYNRFEPDVTTNFPHLPRYLKHGFEVVGASAAKGADGHLANVPNFDRRLRNVFAWADVARRRKLTGVVSPAWSRDTYLLPPCEPFETMWLTVAGSAEAYWTGRPPSPGALVQAFLRLGGGRANEELIGALLHLERGRYDKVAGLLRARAGSGAPWADYWRLLSVLYELETWMGRREGVERDVLHSLPLLEAGRLSPHSRKGLSDRIRQVVASGRALRLSLKRELRKTLPAAEVEEFVASRLDGYLVLLQGLAEAAR